MNWEIGAAIASIVLAIGTIIGVFIKLFTKCGSLLHQIEILEKAVEENKQKSIESDKAHNEKIDTNKAAIEEKLESTENSLEDLIKEKVIDLSNSISVAVKSASDVKVDLENFKWEVTVHLMDTLKENMTDLVSREIDKLNDKHDSDIASLIENWDSSKDSLEDKIEKLERKIENIEYKDIRPIKETIAELKHHLKDK